ncbi:MAG: DUF4384 domain-containing protein [Candidatus Hydrothermales bacterium]
MKKFIFLTLISLGLLDARMVEVWIERGHKAVYTSGERLKVNLISKVDGYLYLFNIDPTGKSKLIFPLGKPVYINAGVHYVLPDDFYDDIEWFSSYEPGIEYIYAVVVPYPIYDLPNDCFEPLPPHSFIYYEYDDIDFVVIFKFRPPFWFPRIYFGAWTSYYVIPRYYVYHPAPWYCYDCHHPRIFFHFYFDFCPIYEIRVYEYRYIYVPRYVKSVPERYRVRTRWEFSKEITPERKVRLREIEKDVRLRVREEGIVEGKEVKELIKIREKPQIPETRDIREIRNVEKEKEVIRKIERKPSEKKEVSEIEKKRIKYEEKFAEEREEQSKSYERKESYRGDLRHERQMKVERQKPTKIPNYKESSNLKGRGVIPENRIENKRSRR